MAINLRPSQVNAMVAQIAPAAQAVSTILSGWVDFAQFEMIMGVIQNGVLGAAATVDAKFRQALDNIGTGAKDVTATIIPQMVKATDDNKSTLINVLERDLDSTNGFRFIALSITVGVAASITGGMVLGYNERYGPTGLQNAAAIVKGVTN